MTSPKPYASPEFVEEFIHSPAQAMTPRRIGFLIFPEVEIVDLCGPIDVFLYADRWIQLTGKLAEPGYEVVVIAETLGPVKTSGGLQIIATHGFDDVVGGLDTLVVPGSPWIEGACAETKLIAWLKAVAPHVRRLVSVCTGAFVLATAGLLENRRVTTHWMYCDRLAATYPTLRIDRDRIFVRDGHVYTSGGITAGIDLALALVEEDLGRDAPRFVAGMMVVFLRRPGGQNQFSVYLQAEAAGRTDLRELQAWILANPGENLGVESLAARLAMSPRNFARLFRAETGTTPAKFVENARVEAARCKLEQTDLLLEAIAEATGFGSAERMQRSFQRLLNVNPQEYRARFQSTVLKQK